MLKLLAPRWRKVIRDIVDNKARTVLVVLAIAVGVFAFGGVFITQEVLISDMNTGYATTNPATISFSMSPFTESDVRTIRNFDDVVEAEAQAQHTVSLKVQGQDRYIPMTITAVPDFEDMHINRVEPELGNWPPSRRELFVERTTLPLTGAQIGDTITVELADGSTKELILAGTVHDFNAIPASLFPQLSGYATLDTIAYLGGSDAFTSLNIITPPEYDTIEELETVADRLSTRLDRYGHMVFFQEVTAPGRHWAADVTEAFVQVLSVIGFLSLALSGFLVINTVTAILAQQKRQVGMMKSIGARGSQVMMLYLVMAGVFGVLSLVVALPIGAAMAYVISLLIAAFLNFDIINFHIPTWVLGLQFLTALVTPLIAALIPVLAGAKTTVREAVSDYGIGSVKRSWVDNVIEAVIGSLKGLSRPTMLSLRNTFRRKGRLVLTMATLTMAGAIFVAVINVRGSLILELDKILAVFGYDVQIALGEPVPLSKVEREAMRVDGVTGVEGWGVASATRIRDDDVEGTTYTILGPPANTAFIEPSIAEGRWLQEGDTNAIVVSTQLLQDDPDVGVGDTIKLDFGDVNRDMEVVGVVNLIGAPFAYADFTWLTRTTGAPGQTFVAMVGTEDDSAAFEARVARDLETRFKRAGIPVTQTLTTATIIGANVSQFNFLVGFMLFMAVLLAVVGGLGLASTMSLNVLERTREIGVMRAVGAADKAVRGVFWTEGMIIGIMSWVLAIALSIPMSYGFAAAIGNAFFDRPMDFTFSVPGAVIWLILVLVISSLASLLPSNRAAQVSVRESLAYE